ncbi:MAG: hypothetical protein KA715_13295 [Xanthomonadaceae bacterium]|nr:hypothetical protein [Xanthomonadaceae bacterium]
MTKYLGLELSGAKNQKTTLCVLEYFKKEDRVFLLNLIEGIGPDEDISGDEQLLDCLTPYQGKGNVLTSNVPTSFPPCAPCTKEKCGSVTDCRNPEAKWMKAFAKNNHVTPYTMRPVDLWLRRYPFEVDETLGGSRAPLTARMVYLKNKLKKFTLLEANPKISTLKLGESLKISPKVLENIRSLERGPTARKELLTRLMSKHQVFIYDGDFKKICQNLTAYDAFICGYTGFLSEQGKCEKRPKTFPKQSAWVEIPC